MLHFGTLMILLGAWRTKATVNAVNAITINGIKMLATP